MTLGLQAALVYVFFVPFVAAYVGAVAGSWPDRCCCWSPGRWRWPVRGRGGQLGGAICHGAAWARRYRCRARPSGWTLYRGADRAIVGLVVFGLSRLAGLAAQLEELHAGLAQAAVVRERLRIARDVHDLLGLGLSAIALKADLIGQLIGRDGARAAAELGELGRICAAARADARLVTAGGQRLSLAAELAAARQILTSAGVEVQAESRPGRCHPWPMTCWAPCCARRSPTSCGMPPRRPASSRPGPVTARSGCGSATTGCPSGRAGRRPGSGLANLTARVRRRRRLPGPRQADGRFDLVAEIPLAAPPR